MATRPQRRKIGYGFSNPFEDIFPAPIVAQRAPTTKDQAQLGSLWIDQPNDDLYFLTKVAVGVSTWIPGGGGTGVFTNVTASGYITSGGAITAGTTLTVSGLTAGVVQSSAAGLFSSTPGTDGQLLIGSTAAAAVFGAITSATLVITPGAGTLNIEESGGTANSYVTDVAGPVVPLVGVLDVLGGSNITTDGTVANTITIDLDNNVAVSGSMSAGVDLNMLAGDLSILATTNAAQTIYLHANAGANETIDIHSDAGTGLNSLNFHSDTGGVYVDGGVANVSAIRLNASNAAGGLNFDAGTGGIAADTTGAISLDSVTASNFTVTGGADLTLNSSLGSVNIESGEGVNDAIDLFTSNAAGGIRMVAGTGGISVASNNGTVAITSGTGALNVGADATVHTSTFGGTTGAAATIIQSGTGDLVMTSTDAFTVDGAGVVEFNSSAGIISVGNDAINQNINIATGGDRTLTLGNTAGATQIDLETGTGALNVGVDATVHTTTVGSVTGAAATVIQSGTGDLVMTSTDDMTLDCAGVMEFNSSADAISIGGDADAFAINLGTGAAQRDITIGNITGTTSLALNAGSGNIAITATDSSISLNSGTGAVNVGTDAASHSVIVGSTTGAADTTIQSGTGGITMTTATGDFLLTSSTGAINIGTDAAVHVVTMGSITGAAGTVVQSGTGDLALTSTDAIEIDGAGGVDVNSTGGDISIGNDANATDVYICTGAAARDLTLGSVNSTSSTTVQSGTGDLILTSTDAITVDCAGVMEFNSTVGDISIGNDADATDVHICTGAAAKNLTCGSTNTTSSTTVQSGTGGVSIEAAGIVDIVPATATVAGVGLTIDANVGVGTFTGQATAAAATQVFTITNSVCTAGSAILVSASNLGGNDCQMTITRVTPAGGSFTVTLTNNGAAQLNGDVIITFFIIAA